MMFALLLALAAAPVENVENVEEDEHNFSFAAVPTLTFSTDEGFGTGGVATMYHRHQGVLPYRDAVTANIFISSKLVQAHALTWDALRPFDIAGRLYVRGGYYATVSQNYCGIGNDVACASGEALDESRRLGLQKDPSLPEGAVDEFERHYHLMRFIRPYATVIARPWLRDKPWRTEVLLGWRGAVVVPGDLAIRGPYPGSLFAKDFPGGQAGTFSVPFAGIVIDDRDTEAFPTRGFFFESSVRGAHALTGSSWPHAGVNASLASFLSMTPQGPKAEPRVVLASRVIADVMVGEPSVQEMARIGGTLDSNAFGGSSIGRGVREHRYLGKVKLIGQAELRAQLFEHEVFGEVFNHGCALFTDAGLIGADVLQWRGNPAKLLTTFGVSYRMLWNESFAIRWDLALSPDEAEGPGFYIIVGQAF